MHGFFERDGALTTFEKFLNFIFQIFLFLVIDKSRPILYRLFTLAIIKRIAIGLIVRRLMREKKFFVRVEWNGRLKTF